MEPVDVLVCASANSAKWQTRAAEVLSRSIGADGFEASCQRSSMGTNVTASKLLHFLDGEEIVPTYSYVAAQRGAGEADVAVHGGTWGRRRLSFENAIGAADAAIYGTLDLPGTAGDDRYGPFRLVVQVPDDSEAHVVLPHNSAAGYGEQGPARARASICADIARWEDRAAVAVAERGTVAASVPSEEWGRLLAAEDPTSAVECDLIEVVDRATSVPLAEVGAIRFSRATEAGVARAYAGHLAKVATGDPTASVCSEAVAVFARVTQLADEGRMAIEVVG